GDARRRRQRPRRYLDGRDDFSHGRIAARFGEDRRRTGGHRRGDRPARTATDHRVRAEGDPAHNALTDGGPATRGRGPLPGGASTVGGILDDRGRRRRSLRRGRAGRRAYREAGRTAVTYTIAEPCVDVLDKACIEECPVDCIYEGGRMLYIHPDEC